MKHIVAALFVFTACKAKEKQAEAPPAPAAPPRAERCAAALVSFDRYVDTGTESATPEARTEVKRLVLEHCLADNWSDPALECMRVASSGSTVFKCWHEQLTREQRDAVNAALETLKL